MHTQWHARSLFTIPECGGAKVRHMKFRAGQKSGRGKLSGGANDWGLMSYTSYPHPRHATLVAPSEIRVY